MNQKLFIKVILISFFMVASCGNNGKKSTQDLSNKKINVVTTIGMITDAVRNVGGERVKVTGLMGPGIDPHLYKASEGDVIRMAEADIIFYNGLHLEGKMTEIFERMQHRITTVAVTDGIEQSRLLSPPEFKGAYDPHVWFDVNLWIKIVEKIRDSFIEFDHPNKEDYQTNAAEYIKKLGELHDHVLTRANQLPDAKRILITAHDAFNYFGRAYRFNVRGLQGISTAAEAGTADVQALAQFIVSNQVPAIFVETSVPQRYIEALQEAVTARNHEVKIGGHLFSDAMGNPNTPEGTYIGMVHHNIDTIVTALSK